MNNAMVQVPVSLLLDQGLTGSAKVVWIASRLAPKADPTELVALTGLSRHSVLAGLNHVKRNLGGAKVEVPGALLADRSVGSQAKVLYGLLQAIPAARGQRGTFTYAALSAFAHLSVNTTKSAIGELSLARWIELSQVNRRKPIHFKLGSPEARRSQREALVASRRLKRALYSGEALMQEYLSLLIDLDDFADNARPGFLVNPQTGERLELDRFYSPRLAFEFNGLQHYAKTEKVSQAEVEAQHQRDLIKAGLCLYRGMQLVIIHDDDLSLQGMIDRLPAGVPRRSLEGHEPLIDLLEGMSMSYRASVQAARQRRVHS